MKPTDESEAQKGCSEVLDVDVDDALLDYADVAERTSGGKYRCRDCGKVFDTLEAHDKHHREVHGLTEKYPLEGLPM